MTYIYCDINASDIPDSPKEIFYIQSPLTCLSLAEIHTPDYIFICFPFDSGRKHTKLLELCGCLKTDKRTKNIPLIALLRFPNRFLISTLLESPVDHIQFYQKTLSPAEMSELIDGLETIPKPAEYLACLCPYLDYEPFNETEEIVLCGAYFDRLVINQNRLLKTCITGGHCECGYYLQPRVRA